MLTLVMSVTGPFERFFWEFPPRVGSWLRTYLAEFGQPSEGYLLRETGETEEEFGADPGTPATWGELWAHMQRPWLATERGLQWVVSQIRRAYGSR